MANDVLKQAFSLDTLLKCKGYISTFIDNRTSIGFETVLGSRKSKLPKVLGNDHGVLCYSNLSVLYDKERKVPFFSAYNIDGSKKAKKISRANDFRPDPHIDTDIQLTEPNFYDLDKSRVEFEIGHMAANNEMAWGSDAQLQCYQTFHFPNSAPQAENLNTGIWKTPESYIIREAASDESNKRISVFTGPLLLDSDPGYVKLPSFKIPLLFFKVIVFMSAKGLYSTAFMMSHEQKMIEQKMFVAGYKPEKPQNHSSRSRSVRRLRLQKGLPGEYFLSRKTIRS
jgi:endonuclease G